MSDIVVVGSLNVDLVVQAQRAPGPGETISGQDFQIIPGGKGANQAAAVARLGGDVAMVGRAGSDAFGPQLLENLTRQGVDTSRVTSDPEAPTGTALIIVESSGENRIVVVAGANGRVALTDVEASEEVIGRAKALVLQFEVPLATVECAMDVAIRHSVPVILNPAPAYEVPSSFLRKAKYLILNESETKVLSGLEVTDISSCREAADRLREYGVDVVVLTLGEQGAWLATGEGAWHLPTRPVDAVDTTAAGDAFVGGFAVSLARNLSLPDAVRYANGAGTLAVTKLGAQTSLPTAQEVEAFIS
jgi:ribokinase